MVRKFLIFILIASFSVIFINLYQNFKGQDKLNDLSTYYAENEPQELGAQNLVTSIVVTYRGFDTLGEVTILFLAASIIGFFLKIKESDKQKKRDLRKTSEILETASKILVPLIFLLGVYVFANGHLTPGGGFQGGAIMASGMVLLLLANPEKNVKHSLFSGIESISGFTYVILGLLGIYFAYGFLDNRVLPLGQFGNIFSAGLIPLIYTFIGLKVGSELTNIVGNLKETQKETE